MIRKNNILPQLAIALGLAAILGGCVRDEIFESTQSDGSAQVTLALSLGKASEITVTKADDNSYANLSSLLLLIYDANGTNIKKIVSSDGIYSYPDEGETLTIGSERSETDSGYKYDITLNMPVGESKVLAIGHYTSASAWNGGTDGNGTISLSEYMKSVCDDATNSATLAEVQEKIYYLASGYSKTGSTLDMTESSIVPSGTATVTVTESSGTATVKTDSGTIEMKRQVAWINFKIKDGADTLSFVPKHYTVYNIPTQVSIEQVDDATNNDLEASCYYSTQNIGVAAASGGTYSFSFMMPENITTTESSVDDYHARDEWDGYEESTRNTYDGGNYTQKKWTNAPANSTYVVIHGEYTSWKDGTEKYSGDVNYTIHLGDFSGSGSLNNFAVERNTKYTYNITVKGVNEIVAECTTDTEKQPGAEGHIYNVANSALDFILDAHFEQVLLKYNLSDIAEAAKTSLSGVASPTDEEINEAIGKNMILLIESPYQDEAQELEPYTIYSKYSTTTDQATAKNDSLKNVDYKWVEFLPQEDTEAISRYPGIPDWGRLNGVDGRTGKSGTGLMDVYDVCVAMGKVVKEIYGGGTTTTGQNDDGIYVIEEDNEYYAVFTGFVDEYFYTTNPLDEGSTTWADFANKDPRSMIVIYDTQVSDDKNSSYSEIHTRIVQRSIQTFYDETKASTLNAFGMETFNETPMCAGIPGPTEEQVNAKLATTSYGRENTLLMMTSASIRNGNWSDYINTRSNGWTESISEGNTGENSKRLNNAAYNGTVTVPTACLSRNRDLDGDGVIDDNEVIWYLASTDEYIAVGIGESVMSGESNLFFGDKSTLPSGDNYYSTTDQYGARYHTSNYYNPDYRTYWAVEKAAYGNQTGNMYIRCVRSLPKNDNDYSYDQQSDDLVTQKSLDENTVLDFRNVLTSSLYRQSSITGALPEHNEDDKPLNGFYKGIVVSTTNGYISATLSNIVNLDGTGTNPCGDYCEEEDGSDKGAWRPPNLDELYLMGSLSLLGTVKINNTTYKDIVCATKFTNTSVRTGFAYDVNASRIWCIQNAYNATLYTRCVRDATDDELDSAQE